MTNITALPVVRDKYGCWTHPEYDKFCDGRDHIPNSEGSWQARLTRGCGSSSLNASGEAHEPVRGDE